MISSSNFTSERPAAAKIQSESEKNPNQLDTNIRQFVRQNAVLASSKSWSSKYGCIHSDLRCPNSAAARFGDLTQPRNVTQ